MDDDAVELLAAGPDVCLNVTRRGPVALFNAAQASAFPERDCVAGLRPRQR